AKVDRIVVGGDVLPGPMPRETISCLMDLEVPVEYIQGKGDREGLARMRGLEAGNLPEAVREVMRWTAHQLLAEHEQLLAGWEKTLTLNLSGLGEVLFCHATPRNDTEIFSLRTSEERLLPVFAGTTASL